MVTAGVQVVEDSSLILSSVVLLWFSCTNHVVASLMNYMLLSVSKINKINLISSMILIVWFS